MIRQLWYNFIMRFKKDGSPDKRFKDFAGISKTTYQEPVKKITDLKETTQDKPVIFEHEIDAETLQEIREVDPQLLFNELLEANNLQLDFDVLEGSIPTQYGIIKLDKPTLVVKATYKEKDVTSK